MVSGPSPYGVLRSGTEPVTPTPLVPDDVGLRRVVRSTPEGGDQQVSPHRSRAAATADVERLRSLELGALACRPPAPAAESQSVRWKRSVEAPA